MSKQRTMRTELHKTEGRILRRRKSNVAISITLSLLAPSSHYVNNGPGPWGGCLGISADNRVTYLVKKEKRRPNDHRDYLFIEKNKFINRNSFPIIEYTLLLVTSSPLAGPCPPRSLRGKGGRRRRLTP